MDISKTVEIAWSLIGTPDEEIEGLYTEEVEAIETLINYAVKHEHLV